MKAEDARRMQAIVFLFAALLLLPAFCGHTTEASDSPRKLAAHLLHTAGVKGGLAAHVGCGKGRMTAALHRQAGLVMHGLDRSETNVARARTYLKEQGLYGNVSVARWSGGSLPYAGGVLDLLIVENPDRVASQEILRVLAPGGVALVRTENGWNKRIKSRPEAIDEWPHYLHGPNNNAVSRDERVGPPQSTRWVTSFPHLRHHNYLSSISAMVSAGGRLFTIEDKGSRMSIDLPPEWRLVARGAFNGVALWEKPIESWVNTKHGFRSGPLEVNRRLVATRDRVFATLSYEGPVVALDAATGEEIRSYKGTDGVDEILLDSGTLYLTLSEPPTRRKKSPRRVMAVDANTGEILWENDTKAVENTVDQTLTVGQNRIFLHNDHAVVCLNRGNGEIVWQKEVPTVSRRPSWSAPTMVYYDGVIFCADRATDYPERWKKVKSVNNWMTRHGGPAEVRALSAETGKVLWTEKAAENFHAPVNVYVIDGLVWFGRSFTWWFGESPRPELKKTGEGWYKEDPLLGRDPHTGEVKRKIHAGEVFTDSHHHRCYRGKATERFILMGRTGVEFIDVEGDIHRQHHWIRGTCQYGILPANGLLYIPPHPCVCYIESKLNGFRAFSAEPVPEAQKDGDRIEKGEAYGSSPEKRTEDGDWPTYRSDAARSGFGTASLSRNMKKDWAARIGGRLSSPVAAHGKVFVSDIDEHTVHALDLRSGDRLWSFTAAGRIDSPPTYWQGRVYFGSADGCVYCVEAAEGRLVWRFRAAPHDRLIPAHGQFESAWPVPGSVLIKDGKLYCMAGRSSYIDGGMYFVKLDAVTGEPLLVKNKYSRDPETGRQPPERGWEFGNNALELPGLLQDVLSSRGDSLFLRQVQLSESGERIDGYDTHLFNPMGFLSDEWWHRAYTVYGKRYYSGPFVWPDAGKKWPCGRTLVFDEKYVYGFGRRSPRGPGNRGYRLYGVAKKDGQDGWKPSWETQIPVLAYAMALTNPRREDGKMVAQRLWAAGPPRQALRSQEAAAGEKGGSLLSVDPRTGEITSETALDAVPVQDGLCTADGKVVLTMQDGTIIALSGQ